jgi:hypothetical protein
LDEAVFRVPSVNPAAVIGQVPIEIVRRREALRGIPEVLGAGGRASIPPDDHILPNRSRAVGGCQWTIEDLTEAAGIHTGDLYVP